MIDKEMIHEIFKLYFSVVLYIYDGLLKIVWVKGPKPPPPFFVGVCVLSVSTPTV